jgi:hypothetical protein
LFGFGMSAWEPSGLAPGIRDAGIRGTLLIFPSLPAGTEWEVRPRSSSAIKGGQMCRPAEISAHCSPGGRRVKRLPKWQAWLERCH